MGKSSVIPAECITLSLILYSAVEVISNGVISLNYMKGIVVRRQKPLACPW